METKQEKSFEDVKQDSINLLCRMQEMSFILQLKKELEEKIEKCSIIGVTEQDYCSISARILTLNEVIENLNEKIGELTKKD